MLYDSPSTTSAVTYKITAHARTGTAGAHRTNYNYTNSGSDDTAVHGDLTGYGSRSTMILMEVSG